MKRPGIFWCENDSEESAHTRSLDFSAADKPPADPSGLISKDVVVYDAALSS